MDDQEEGKMDLDENTEDADIIINEVDGLPNVHPNYGEMQLQPGGSRQTSEEARTMDEMIHDEDLPTSLIVTNIDSSVFVNEEKKKELEALFSQFCPPTSFQFFRSFRRMRVNYRCPAAAAKTRIHLHQMRFGEGIINCYFAQPVSPIDIEDQHLHPPPLTKQFLISPPSSPPVGWAPREEREPLVNYDLLAAIANLTPATDVQARWKCLREKYVRERNGTKAASGSGAIQKPTWEFFDSLKWLDSYIAERKTKSNDIKDSSTNVVNSNIVFDFNDEESNCFSHFLNSSQPTLYIPSPNSTTEETIPSPESSSTFPPFPSAASSSFPSAAKNRKVEDASLIGCVNLIGKSMANRNTVLAAKSTILTDDEKFCMALAAEMANITDKKRKRNIKKKIFSMVLDGADCSDDD